MLTRLAPSALPGRRCGSFAGRAISRRGLVFRFRSSSSAVRFDSSEVAPVKEWPEQTVFAGTALVLRGTHDEDLAGQTLSAWAYPDGSPESAVEVAAGTWSIAGARTFEGLVAADVTAAWAGQRIVIEVWFESSTDPVAWGAVYFVASGRPS